MDSVNITTQRPFVSFLLIAAIFQIVGGFIGWISGPGIDGWYESLARSPLNPPSWAFAIVWPSLYFLLSFAFWTVWKNQHFEERGLVLGLFSLHMLLNWLWSPLFFIAHQLLSSFLLILALIFTASMLLWLIWPMNRKAAFVFVPYLGWLTFAGHLSHFIWKNNS